MSSVSNNFLRFFAFDLSMQGTSVLAGLKAVLWRSDLAGCIVLLEEGGELVGKKLELGAGLDDMLFSYGL